MPKDPEIHDLFDFMQQITSEMDAEYNRIQGRALEDPGTAGDQGEENWATLLKGWLPTNYEVVTKGRIIGHDGQLSPQIDIVVLNSSYPARMRDKKIFLAGGVVAAFECKNTLKKTHLKKVVETSQIIKNMSLKRTGSPYKELQSPIVYGLLAHSHSWKQPKSTPIENIGTELLKQELTTTQHPRELLDLVCVADLAMWSRSKIIYIGTTAYNLKKDDGTPLNQGAMCTSFVCNSEDHNNSEQAKPFTPIGCLISYIFSKIAYEDRQLGAMSQYYRSVGMQGSGSGTLRHWPESVFSDKIKAEILGGKLVSGSFDDEWSYVIS